MCNPAAAVVGLNVFGGAYSYNAQRESGESQREYYNYLAAANDVQAEQTERTARAQAGLIQESAAAEARGAKSLGRRFSGAQKVALAANGVPLSSATAEDIARDTMTKEELDQEAIRFNADSKVWESATAAAQTAKNLREQGRQFRYAGENAKRTAEIGANTSLLSAATNIATAWYTWNKTSINASPQPGPTVPRYANVAGRVGAPGVGRISVAPSDFYLRTR